MIEAKPNRCIINTNNNNKEEVLLTIAIPTYKRFELLKKTLQSVFDNEFSFSVEIIVVDNDPDNDAIAEYEMLEFKSKKIKYYKNIDNYGMFGNWNQCLTLAKGKYITILHDDDILKDNFGSVLSKTLSVEADFYAFNCSVLDERTDANKPNSHILYSSIKAIYSFIRNIRHKIRRRITIKKLFVLNVFMGTLGVVIHRDKALQINGFDESFYPIADYDFWYKWIASYGPVYIEPKTVACYRIRENESMQQETIDKLIEKDFQLRKKICTDSKSMYRYRKYVNLLRMRDTLLFNFSWSNDGAKYKKNTSNMLKYFMIRIMCIIIFI